MAEAFIVIFTLIVVGCLFKKHIENSKRANPIDKLEITTSKEKIIIEKEDRHCNELETLIEKEEKLKEHYHSELKYFRFDKERFGEVECFLKALKNIEIEKNELVKKSGNQLYVDDYYFYNLAEVYYVNGEIEEAQKIFEEGFENLKEKKGALSRNLREKYKYFLKLLIEIEEIEKMLESIKKVEKNIVFSNEEKDEFIKEIGRTLAKKVGKKENSRYLFEIANENRENKTIEEILFQADKEEKIYSNIEKARQLYKVKEYKKAKECFEIALRYSEKCDEDIRGSLEKYGDILYKEKIYEEAIKNYEKAYKYNSEKHRHYFKIGDCYKMIKNYEKAMEYYFYALFFKEDYKSAQINLERMLRKNNKNIELMEIMEKLKEKNTDDKTEFFWETFN